MASYLSEERKREILQDNALSSPRWQILERTVQSYKASVRQQIARYTANGKSRFGPLLAKFYELTDSLGLSSCQRRLEKFLHALEKDSAELEGMLREGRSELQNLEEELNNKRAIYRDCRIVLAADEELEKKLALEIERTRERYEGMRQLQAKQPNNLSLIAQCHKLEQEIESAELDYRKVEDEQAAFASKLLQTASELEELVLLKEQLLTAIDALEKQYHNNKMQLTKLRPITRAGTNPVNVAEKLSRTYLNNQNASELSDNVHGQLFKITEQLSGLNGVLYQPGSGNGKNRRYEELREHRRRGRQEMIARAKRLLAVDLGLGFGR